MARAQKRSRCNVPQPGTLSKKRKTAPAIVKEVGSRVKYYKRALKARANATEKKVPSIPKPVEEKGENEEEKQEEKIDVLPTSLPPFDRFFAGLLMSDTSNFIAKKANGKASTTDIWDVMCQRFGIPLPDRHLKPCYDKPELHFDYRAALVAEESRHKIAEGVSQAMKSKHSNSNDFNYRYNTYNHKSGAMILNLSSVDHKKKTGHSILTFHKENGPFSTNELANLRLGSVLACVHTNLYPTIPSSLLGVVVPRSREEMISESSFSIKVFRSISPMVTKSALRWNVFPITSLLAEQRQFEACTCKVVRRVPFLQALLGTETSTPTKLEQNGMETQTPGVCTGKPETEFATDPNETFHDEAKTGISTNVENMDKTDSVSICNFVEDFDGDSIKSDTIDNNIDKGDRPELLSFSQSLDLFHNPVLNEVQDNSARAFLSSEKNKISLIQGPPGTGKTTLLVSILCRHVAESLSSGTKRRVMVCAPTNKAISVLCTRFLNSIKGDTLPCGVILVGDAEKLMCDDSGWKQNFCKTKNFKGYKKDNSDNGTNAHNTYDNGREYNYDTPGTSVSSSTKLRSVFLHTWKRAVLDDLGRIRKFIEALLVCRNKNGGQMMISLLKSLAVRLPLSLPKTRKWVREGLDAITKWIELDASSATGKAKDVKQTLQLLDRIAKEIGGWEDKRVMKELLGTSQVIFCTLASGGSGIMKKSVGAIDDLIVDEAAASTEPEMYIPFRYGPERLLAVGDPKQLPATVFSQRAEKYGLGKSLHERLMYDCNSKYTMLNVQYRMKPALSCFPSSHFYKGELEDGPNVTSTGYRTGRSIAMKGNGTYSLVQISGTEQKTHSGSTENLAEAKAVVWFIERIRKRAMQQQYGVDDGGNEWYSADRIRVITFYQAQVNLIKSLLPTMGPNRKSGVVVATVDSTQGCESDIVIVSFVRSNSKVGFLTDNRRMNVALTRAKYQMICVGNFEWMLKSERLSGETVRALVQDAKDRRCF